MIKNEYRPDYAKLYPGVHISAEVLSALKKSDCKIEYMQYDLKREKWDIDLAAETAKCKPSREDSYDRLLDEDCQFAQGGASVEDEVEKNILLEKLRLCIGLLEPDERELIDALFFSNGGDGMTEQDYAKTRGIPRTTISYRKFRALSKIREYLEK